MLWGFCVEQLDRWGTWLLIASGILGLLALAASGGSAYVLKRVADVSQSQLVEKTKQLDKEIAEQQRPPPSKRKRPRRVNARQRSRRRPQRRDLKRSASRQRWRGGS